MKARRITSAAIAVLVLAVAAGAAVGQPSAEDLLRDIKLALFDSRWQTALEASRRLQSAHPGSPLARQAVYYEANALEKMGSQSEAIRKYDDFLKRPVGGSLLVQQARLSMINLAVELYGKGQRSWIEVVRKALSDDDKGVRYYAALRLSAVPNKSEARRAIPVLREILRNEKDEELRNRAILALLRIDPKLVDDIVGSRQSPGSSQTLHLEIVSDGEKVSLRFPLSMAQWLIDAIPPDALEELKAEGIDARNLIDELRKAGGNIVEVRSKDGLFRLWIE